MRPLEHRLIGAVASPVGVVGREQQSRGHQGTFGLAHVGRARGVAHSLTTSRKMFLMRAGLLKLSGWANSSGHKGRACTMTPVSIIT